MGSDKVTKTAKQLGLEVSVTTLERPTRTVGEAAAAVGCQDAQIAKSIVFISDGDPVLVVASGKHRIDLDKLCDALDCAEVRTATPEEVRASTGFSVGGVPPFGHGLPVIFDAELLDHDCVYAAGGDGNSLFQVSPQRLADCTAASVAVLA
jgi:prolyl-tRNA editing enzyme YbaK/EbsC (Cys-tRNA(Pro) deacylase)